MTQPQGRPLRVLIVAPRYFPTVGGVQNHTYQLARRLAQSGDHVTVLSTNPDGRQPVEEISEGFQIRRMAYMPANRDYYFAPALTPIVAGGGWDIVHMQSYHTLMAPMTMLAARQAGIPYIVTFHGGGHSSALRNALRGVHRRLLRPLFADAACLIATARFEPDLFGRALGIPLDKFRYIPNGGDLPTVEGLTSTPGDPSLIVSVGRLERYKGHHRVLAAMPYVIRERPDVRLWIAGAGPSEAELRRLTHQLRVYDHVEIAAVPPSERGRYAERLAQAGLVVALSAYETHPMAVLEAITLGRSVLVARTPGLDELAADGFARSVAPEAGPQVLARAILDQLAHPLKPPYLRLSSWDACAAQVRAVYHEILGAPRIKAVDSSTNNAAHLPIERPVA